MKLELTNINPYECTLAELEDEIQRLKDIKDQYYNLEQAIKVFINSIYGALASPFFSCYNIALAEAVTLQGQDLIKYTGRFFDDYFKNYWHKDTEAHAKLGVRNVSQVSADSLIIYNDTDSVSADTIVITTNGKIRIEDWYNNNIINGSAGDTLAGHESVLTDDLLLNWSDRYFIYYEKVKRIIRHKVTKPKWRLTTLSDDFIDITNDHSMVVFRDKKQIVVKPCEILPTDLILKVTFYHVKDALTRRNVHNTFYHEQVKSCECIGNFEDEYVYDVEMDDDTHTFIANRMLVHNSAYATLAPVLDSCKFDCQPLEMIHKINDFILTDLFNKRLDEYAKKFNTENLQVLELEKISYNVLMIAKKKYILNLAWKDPGVFYKKLEKIKPTGIELVQGSTPKFARKILKEMVYRVMDKGKSLTYPDIVKQLKVYRNEFTLQHPDDISKTLRIGDYEKYVLDDKKRIQLGLQCPFHTRGAALYNNLLYNNKWKTKYNIIRSGDKVKNYYTTDGNSFSYLPNMYPVEFAPSIDFNQQYAKVVITPFNKYINALGFRDVPQNLIYARPLF